VTQYGQTTTITPELKKKCQKNGRNSGDPYGQQVANLP